MTAQTLHARAAWLTDGWHADTRLTLTGGRIAGIETGVPAAPGDTRVDHLVPGMGNLHSHAFQRAFSGLTEARGNPTDTFWTWREAMYRFALTMAPDQLEAVAAQLYMEMLEAGFTRVGEFHYLHHAPDGRPYDDIAELAARHVAAAGQTGIGLTLLPSFYAHGNFGGQPPVPGQRRFLNTPDSFALLLDRCRALTAGLPGAVVGVAPHSLRAVAPDELAAVVAMAGTGPIHIHVAEQVKEVEDCLAWSGARPLEWLLDHAPVDARWCLIHATHLTEAEITRADASGATVGLCPVTEANLGDGIFAARRWLREGTGRIGIGSDSNVRIGVAAELAQLEYSQRLARRERNVLAAGEGSTGQALFADAVAGGARALACDAGIAPGREAGFTALTTADAPWLQRQTALDGWIFGMGVRVDAVWAGGRQVVRDGRHIDRDRIAARFAQAMAGLMA